MGTIWVYAEATDGKVASITLELLAKARELGDVEAVYAGGDADAIAAELGEHGASKVYGGRRPRTMPPRRPSRGSAALAAAIEAGAAPTPCCSAPPTTAATWPPACR